MIALDAQDVGYFHGSLHVLNGVSLSVEDGEFVSIIGQSGCGKTTLLKILGGLLPPATGSLSVKGKPIDVAIKRRDFGFVFQDPVLLAWRNVLQNTELPLEIIGGKTAAAESARLLELVGLKDFGEYYPSALSGGMKQRVAIARALVCNPSVLLMDEPFGALDELTRERLNFELLRIWYEARKTIVFVTHSILEAVFLSNRVIVLSGRPAQIVATREIDLPFPRTREMRQSKKYLQHVIWLQDQLKES